MARQNLDQVFNSIQIDKSSARKSMAWFDEQVKILSNRVSPASLMQNSSRKTSILIPGKMYLYWYDAKHKDTLPYWDMLPLCIPFARDAETFTCLNFHYLPYKMRAVLLKNLLDFATAKKLTEKSRLQFAWEYVAGISRYRGVSAAVHKYRYDHVQSQFLEIPATQWFLALCLPVEKFVSGENSYRFDKKRVWYESMRYL
jgi:hypothetical protein